MNAVKSYFESDLFNIEEILSILEMRDYLSGDNRAEQFGKYIADVIRYYTPSITPYSTRLPSNWREFIFGNTKWRLFGYFALSIFNYKLKREPGIKENIQYSVIEEPKAVYSVITVNYDLVFENIINFMSQQYKAENPGFFQFSKTQSNIYHPGKVCFAHLHGSVDTPKTIIPPTWNKRTNKDIHQHWEKALYALKEANHLRILGYSLPISDSYIRYLFKCCMLESSHLKSIDVICLDPDGSVKGRYDQFIDFNYYRFKNANIEDYLDKIYKIHKNRNWGDNSVLYFNLLEEAHEQFMTQSR